MRYLVYPNNFFISVVTLLSNDHSVCSKNSEILAKNFHICVHRHTVLFWLRKGNEAISSVHWYMPYPSCRISLSIGYLLVLKDSLNVFLILLYN